MEISCIKYRLLLLKISWIWNLNLFFDDDGLLCVGGRIYRVSIEYKEKYFIIILGNNYIVVLLICYYYCEVKY